MARYKKHSEYYYSDFYGTSGYFYHNCTLEEFIAKCKNDIAAIEDRIRRLLYEKITIEKENQYIDTVEKSCLFAQVGIFVFNALLFASGHWIWGIVMMGGGNLVVHGIIKETESSLLSGKTKKSTDWYDKQIAEEQGSIKQIKRDIDLVKDMLKSRAANGNAGDNSQHRQWDSGYQNNTSTMDIKDFYTILGCSHDASDSEVKTAYRKLAKEYHPDRVRATGLGENITRDAEEKLKMINETYRKIMEARGKK